MPTRGYRKGISDGKRARPEVIKARTGTDTKVALYAEADSRSLTFSELVDRVLSAHTTGQRVELPHPKGVNSGALRELCRQGNNLNQIARQAHVMRLHMLEAEALATMKAINDAARRLAG